MKHILLTTVITLFISSFAQAQFEAHNLYENGEKISIDQVIQKIPQGSVIIVGEVHNLKSHHDNQYEFLKSLRWNYPLAQINVGMEFFDFTKQSIVDEYKKRPLNDEDQFLKDIGWGGDSYDFYRPLVEFPSTIRGERVLALNAPRSLTSKVAKNGLDNLSNKDLMLLPPNFQLGRDIYYDRFKAVMSKGHPMPDEVIGKYFAAQSVWDDTMAYVSSEHMKNNPESFLVIIVGEFHNSYGGGLPDRLKARGVNSVVTISQVNIEGLNEAEMNEAIVSHPQWGARADYVWVSKDSFDAQ